MIPQHVPLSAAADDTAQRDAMVGGVPVSESPFVTALETRRAHLQQALRHRDAHDDVRRLLTEVDAALLRLQQGTFGICETCHEPIEADRLARDPLVRQCSDHPGEAEAQRLARDLSLARSVQRGLLPPRDVRIPGWTLDYRYAAAGDVGGDYIDVIDVPPRDVTLVLVGDVSGKGVAASMLVSHLHATFRSLAPLSPDTGEMLARANDLFLASAPGSAYATLLVAELGHRGTLTLYDAGHCPPLALREGRVDVLATEGGLPIGMFAGSRYAPTRLHAGAADAVLFYTDGASEARDTMGVEFGSERLAVAMLRARASSPIDIVESCLGELRRFAADTGAHDDLTLVALSPDRRPAVGPGS